MFRLLNTRLFLHSANFLHGGPFYFLLNVVCYLKQNVKAFLMPIGKKNKGNLRIKAGNPPGTGKQKYTRLQWPVHSKNTHPTYDTLFLGRLA